MKHLDKQTDYLEIYPSEVAAKKISNHLNKMIEVRPRVYRKTLLRYKKLAYLLLECATKIIRMLQSEMLLTSEDNEFQELVSDFDIEQIDELRDSVDNLGNLIERKQSPESKKLAAITLDRYCEIFKVASTLDFGYYEVNECAQLLWLWISQRFSGFNPNFKFQIKQLPIWATFIVIAYGKYQSIGETTRFVTDFTNWCNGLDADTSNCWALPYNIFNMTKVIDPNNFTVNAMVIYDLLINGCLYQLMDDNTKIPMDSSYIAKLVKEYHPEYSRDVRTRFTRQSELITQICLHPTNDVAEEA